LYWAIAPGRDSGPLRGWSFALKAEYWYEDLQRPDVITGTQAILNLRTQYVPLAWNLFSAQGFSAQLRTTYVDQKGVLQVDPFSNQFPVSDRFWLTDVSLSYRLPGRMGRVSLGVSNVFDRRFNYVQSDPTIMLFAPERVVFGKITATF
jgi:outer membrane receptor protein involved in Fe transport